VKRLGVIDPQIILSYWSFHPAVV